MSLRFFHVFILIDVISAATAGNRNERCGLQTSENQYPWLVNFEYNYNKEPYIRSLCTGALIGKKHAVGKAECFGNGRDSLAKYVRFGPYDTNTGRNCSENPNSNNCTDTAMRVPIDMVLKHSLYLPLLTTPMRLHNIALVVLREIVSYTDFIRPICLPSADITQSTAAEWDLYVTGTSQPVINNIPVNHDTATTYVDKTQCDKARPRQYWFEDDICVIDVKNISGCLIRGSLLMNKRGDSYELVGLSETGGGCTGTRIFTNLFLYVDWIRSKIPEYEIQELKTDYIDASEEQPKSGVCGKRKVEHVELLMDSEVAKAGDWPWHVAIYRVNGSSVNSEYICGGTLISKLMVLTAAHCATINGKPAVADILNVILGKTNVVGEDPKSQLKQVDSVIIHEDFAISSYLENDMALIQLKTEAIYSNYIQPACWFSEAYNRSDRVFGTVVGWDAEQSNSQPSQLKQANISIVSESICMKKNSSLYPNVLDNKKKFCAGWANGTSPCNVDSGSGFLVFVPDADRNDSTAEGSWYIRGIMSFSLGNHGLCDPNQYVVLTDVGKYTDWIQRRVVD